MSWKHRDTYGRVSRSVTEAALGAAATAQSDGAVEDCASRLAGRSCTIVSAGQKMAAPMEGYPCPGISLCRLSGFYLTCHSLTYTLFFPVPLTDIAGRCDRSRGKRDPQCRWCQVHAAPIVDRHVQENRSRVQIRSIIRGTLAVVHEQMITIRSLFVHDRPACLYCWKISQMRS